MDKKKTAKMLNEAWSKREDGKLMKSLFIFVCDDLELLEELYKDDEEMMHVLDLLKQEAKENFNGDFSKLYDHYTTKE